MLHLALRGVRHNTGRYVATLIAIITGIAFFTAAGFVSDRVIQSLEGGVDTQFGGVDVAVIVDPDASADLAELPVVTGETAEAIAALDGVEAVGGVLTGPVVFEAEDGTTFGESTGRLWIADDELNPIEVVDGDAPAASGEVAVDQGLADDEGLAAGDEVTLLSLNGATEVTVVGTTAYGDSDALDDGGTVSVFEDDAPALLREGGREEYEELYLRTSGDPAEVRDEVAELLPTGLQVQTGEDFRADQRDQQGGIGRALKTGLQAFALLALFVGAFVIYNTFSVIVAQRQRELAVLSAIGATPKQIKRALRYEGLVIGLLGSALGVLAGLGLTFLMVFVLDRFGFALPGSGLEASPTTVVQGIVIGTVITFLSVTIPARRAAKVEPIEALRDAAVESDHGSRSRSVLCVALVVLGLVALLAGPNAPVIGVGALLLIVGVIVAGPFIATAGARLLRPVGRRFGLEGRLAVDNSARNPKRTAVTANALLIGVFLVTLVTVAGTSLKDFVVDEIQDLSGADFVVASEGGSIDGDLAASILEVDGVEAIVSFRREAVTVDGTPTLLSTGDLDALVAAADISTLDGSLDDLAPETVAVSDLGDGSAPAVGDVVTVADSEGERVDLEVVATLSPSLDSAQLGSLVDEAAFDALVGDTAPTAAFVDTVEGAQTDVEEALDELTADRPDITVTEGNAIGRLIAGVFDFVIQAVNGLLLMSVIVALIGIVNTLSLSILERRRELGLLRIVGMTDRRVRRMVRLESALISALGTVTGIVLGLVVGWGLIASIDRLTEASVGFGFPALLLLGVLVLGVVLGFLASFLPARRSTHLEVLDAIQAT